jgi:parallel beta-helix repeat protein
MNMRIVDRATGAIVGIVAIFVIALLAGVVSAGPLDPASGPGSTPGVRLPGTPIGSLPVTINSSGHYYLTNNVTGTAGSAGITVAASDVTIDLGGFTMTGPAGSLDGIFVNAPFQNVTVRNGSVVDWDGVGIEVSNAREAVVEDVHVSGSGDSGIVTDIGARISGCTVAENGGHGIDAGAHSVISDCTTSDNTNFGVDAGDQSVIARVTAKGNSVGISAGVDSRVLDCTAQANDITGIRVSATSVVDGCTAADNLGGNGIEGIAASVVIRNCTARNNGIQGITIAHAGLVENCTSANNTQSGIRAQNGGVIRGNTVRANDVHGIHVGSNAIVEGNLADGNGLVTGTGFVADGSGNHIEGNTAVGNDAGFGIVGAANTLIGNTAWDNGAAGIAGEYIFPISTVAGPILDGATVDTATNPYANFAP